MKPKARAAVLLPLHDHEVSVVLDALVAFAAEQEARGDPCRVVADADEISDRLRARFDLLKLPAVETLKACGLGPYRDRPQG